MVADGYKDTEIGVIPVEWDVVGFKQFFNSVGAKKYQVQKSDYIKEGKYPIIDQGQKFIVGYSNDDDKVYKNSNGVIVFGDHTRIIKFIDFNFVVGADGTQLLKSKEDISQKFSYYVLTNKELTNLGYSRHFKLVKEMRFPLPPLKEQEKIADILTTADDKIDAIALQLDRAETLKKGLLQKLLSEGIGHSEFKDSELGKIPESWEVVELSTITTILLSNVDKKSKDGEQDVKLCNYMDVYNNQYITNDLIYMEATAKDNQIEKFQLQIDDVIITKDSETKDDIAIPAVVIETFENLLCGYHLAVLRPKENILYGVYLMNAIHSVNVHKHFEKLANGITRFGLTSSAINQALIPLPPLEEQKQIADILSTADEKLEVLRAKKQMYETLKKGLLQKLLSGKVRVNA